MKKLLLALMLMPVFAYAGWVDKGFMEDDSRAPQVIQDRGQTLCAWPVIEVWEYQITAAQALDDYFAKPMSERKMGDLPDIYGGPVTKNQKRTMTSIFCGSGEGCPSDITACLKSSPQVRVQAASMKGPAPTTETPGVSQ